MSMCRSLRVLTHAILLISFLIAATGQSPTPSREQGSASTAATTAGRWTEPKCRILKGEPVCRVGHGITAPKLVFPEKAPILSAGNTPARCPCTVLLWAVIGHKGQVRDQKVIRPVVDDLDRRAIDEVRRWKFDPAQNGNTPVAVEMNLEVKFE